MNLMEALRESLREILMSAFLMILLLAGGIFVALDMAAGNGLLPRGASVNGIDVSGMDTNQAIDALTSTKEHEMLSQIAVTVRCAGTSRTFTAQDLGVTTNIRTSVRENLLPLSSGGAIKRAEAAFSLREGLDLEFAIKYESDVINEVAKQFAELVYIEPVEATVLVDSITHEFIYTKEEPGQMIYPQPLASQIIARLESGVMLPIDINPVVIQPETTQNMLRETIELLGDCEVAIPENDEETTLLHSLADAINGTVIPSNKDYSLRATLEENGITLPHGEEPASRLSGALYNAALLADAIKVERQRNNALPDYLPMGLGAALSRDKDLILRNSSNTPLYIVATVNDTYLHVEVYGRGERDRPQIRLRGVVDSTVEPQPPLFLTDDNMRKGTQTLVTPAQDGCRVSSYRDYYQGDIFIKSELLALDKYPAIQAVYRVGTLE